METDQEANNDPAEAGQGLLGVQEEAEGCCAPLSLDLATYLLPRWSSLCGSQKEKQGFIRFIPPARHTQTPLRHTPPHR